MKDQKGTTNLNFSEFESLDLNQWMERIQKDLKGKNWEDYQWEIEPGLTMDPAKFDPSTEFKPLFAAKSHTWIGHELVLDNDIEANNKELLDLLMLGISAPKLIIENKLSKEDWENLFQNVSLEYLEIQLEFNSESIAQECLNTFTQARLNIEPKDIVGAVSVVGEKSGRGLKQRFYPDFPKMRFLKVYSSKELIVDQLADILISTNDEFQNGKGQKHSLNDIDEQLLINVSLGNSFLVQIAKLRAARLLINLLADSYGLKNSKHSILVTPEPPAFCGEAELDVIRMTAITLAANLGGADHILLPNLDNDRKEFLQRITSNIQHVLNLESHLGKVGDPLAGSHYLEALTDKIARQAWSKFQELV